MQAPPPVTRRKIMIRKASPITSGMLALAVALLASSCLSFQRPMSSEKPEENSWPDVEPVRRVEISNPVPPTVYLGISLAITDWQNPVMSRIADDSPAQRAGLNSGDVLLAIDGQRLPQDRPFFSAAQPGRPLMLRVRRGEQTLDFEVVPDPPRPR